MNIRTIKEEDWEKLRDLLEGMVHEVPPVALELEPLISRTALWIAKFPKEEQGTFVVAEDKNKIVGFCYLAVPKFYSPVAYIGIAISKKYRKRDIGSRLFYHVAEWAAAQHLQYIIADIWSWNLSSQKFFCKLGFTEKNSFTDKFRGQSREKTRFVKKV